MPQPRAPHARLAAGADGARLRQQCCRTSLPQQHRRCPVRQPQRRQHRRGALQPVRASLVEVTGAFKVDYTLLTSGAIAVSSVALNLWSSLVTERRRAELALELERGKEFQRQQLELQTVIARYRGPLLESAIDLESRLWHLALATNEWYSPEGVLDEEEVMYTVFTICQFLGFVEVVRRESPREASFLQAGNPQGTDTLSTLVEGVRFILASSPAYLQDWIDEGEDRTHPGARGRREELIEDLSSWRPAAKDINTNTLEIEVLRISRGVQRAIGSQVITTPMGADRHYTLAYNDFCRRVDEDEQFAKWATSLKGSVRELARHGNEWHGEPPFPLTRWTRVLLMQQLLVDTMDLLDPDCVRMPRQRRIRMRAVQYGPLPQETEYQRRLQMLSRAGSMMESNKAFQSIKQLVQSFSVDLDEDDMGGPVIKPPPGWLEPKGGAAGSNGKANGGRAPDWALPQLLEHSRRAGKAPPPAVRRTLQTYEDD